MASKNAALQPGWLLAGVQEGFQGITGMSGSSHMPVGIQGQFGDCCSHTGQTGSWGCAAEPLLLQALEHPHPDAPDSPGALEELLGAELLGKAA